MQVLRIARELAEQLHLSSKFDFQRIIWSPELHWHSSGATAGFRKSTGFTLPGSLRNKLEPEDWRCLIARGMFDLKFARRIAAVIILGFLGFVVSKAVVGLYIASTYGIGVSQLYDRTVVALAVVILLLFDFRYAKRKYLSFYEKTANLLGKQTLLQVLGKIDQMKLPDVENAKKRNKVLTWFWIFPNITDVMKHIENQPF